MISWPSLLIRTRKDCIVKRMSYYRYRNHVVFRPMHFLPDISSVRSDSGRTRSSPQRVQSARTRHQHRSPSPSYETAVAVASSRARSAYRAAPVDVRDSLDEARGLLRGWLEVIKLAPYCCVDALPKKKTS
jgi:hypothetical protein